MRCLGYRNAPAPALPGCLLVDDSLPSNPCFPPTSTALNFLSQPSVHRALEAPHNLPHLYACLTIILDIESWSPCPGYLTGAPWSLLFDCAHARPLSGTIAPALCLFLWRLGPRKLHPHLLSETFLSSHSDLPYWSSEAPWPISSCFSFETLHVLLRAGLGYPWQLAQELGGDGPSPGSPRRLPAKPF